MLRLKKITTIIVTAVMLAGCVNTKQQQNTSDQVSQNDKYKGNLEIVIADVKQAQIHNKLKDTTQINNLLDGFEKMHVDGVRITIFGEEVNPNPKMFDYLYHEARRRDFKIFANPALWEGARRIVNRINKGKNTGQKVLGDSQATDILVERILKFSKEYPVDWICPFNEDGKPGQYWTASQISQTYQRLAENNIKAELIGPCTWGVGSGTKILNKTDIKDYISVATTHNLGFEHNKWSKFLKSAKGLKVWDSETNMNKKYEEKDIRIDAAMKAGVNGLVLYDSWKGIDLATGNLNAVGEQWVEKYLKQDTSVTKI
ncbi:hypothetical protein [Flammeovirga sp. SJP92]|uniref:hypothetical protein n=1 Tax=Flammeovirga sp. SJP92 TaxID=1775430 RepID=UPI000786C557|nr:hypothetical protein [Flammeovirga sp. SJP92]KXX69133.1 hypothetical protein AVL50_16985 [Flammeovirga sp. SJP92]